MQRFVVYDSIVKFVLLVVVIEISLNCNWPTTNATLAHTNTTALIGGSAAGSNGNNNGRLPPPPKVKVNKCCLYGEHLDMSKSCVPGNSRLWVPLIYLMVKREYFSPKGESPKFMSFEENVRPTSDMDSSEDSHMEMSCSNAELELFMGGDNILLFSNGSLYLREHSQFVEPQKYCVDREAALVCLPRRRYNQTVLPSLRKCCGRHGIYNVTAKSCQFDTVSSLLPLPVGKNEFRTIYGFPTCQDASISFAIAGDLMDAKLNNKTGQLQLDEKRFMTQDYCLEHIATTEASDIDMNKTDQKTTSIIKVFTCLHHFAKDKSNNDTAIDIKTASITTDHIQIAVLNVGLIISVIFLAATLFAGFLMPSVHHMLHWRCQIFYVICLFVGDFLLAYTQLSQHRHLGTVTCTLIGSAMHFFFLAAFFWLNTMCFNIWWTFRDFRPSSLERSQEIFRFRLYSAYAWGVPLLIATVAACVDQLSNTELLKPGFGERSCWFNGDKMEIFAYFFGPVGILLFINLALFISTTHQLTCGLWKRDDVKSTTEKTALGKVCLKLVIVMGVTWIADVISWLVGGPHSAWFFTDMINALQGVFIFLVVGCQPQVWSALKRLCCPRVRQEITNTTNGVHHSSSSHGLPSVAAGGESTQNTSINATQTKIPMETVC